LKRTGSKMLVAALWIATLGLFLASSGIDGVYLMSWMPVGWGWMGLVLNSVVDLTSELIMYWYGRLRLMPINTKRYKHARWLLLFEGGLIGFQWFFSWLQLRMVLAPVEPRDAGWIAPIAAAFVPFALVAVGYAQALLAGRIDTQATQPPADNAPEPTHLPQKATEPPTKKRYVCGECGGEFETSQMYAAHKRWHCKEGDSA